MYAPRQTRRKTIILAVAEREQQRMPLLLDEFRWLVWSEEMRIGESQCDEMTRSYRECFRRTLRLLVSAATVETFGQKITDLPASVLARLAIHRFRKWSVVEELREPDGSYEIFFIHHRSRRATGEMAKDIARPTSYLVCVFLPRGEIFRRHSRYKLEVSLPLSSRVNFITRDGATENRSHRDYGPHHLIEVDREGGREALAPDERLRI